MADPGRTALYLAGHAVFKALVWRVFAWARIGAAALLLALLALAPHVSALVLAGVALVVVVAVAVLDRWRRVAVPR